MFVLVLGHDWLIPEGRRESIPYMTKHAYVDYRDKSLLEIIGLDLADPAVIQQCLGLGDRTFTKRKGNKRSGAFGRS